METKKDMAKIKDQQLSLTVNKFKNLTNWRWTPLVKIMNTIFTSSIAIFSRIEM